MDRGDTAGLSGHRRSAADTERRHRQGVTPAPISTERTAGRPPVAEHRRRSLPSAPPPAQHAAGLPRPCRGAIHRCPNGSHAQPRRQCPRRMPRPHRHQSRPSDQPGGSRQPVMPAVIHVRNGEHSLPLLFRSPLRRTQSTITNRFSKATEHNSHDDAFMQCEHTWPRLIA